MLRAPGPARLVHAVVGICRFRARQPETAPQALVVDGQRRWVGNNIARSTWTGSLRALLVDLAARVAVRRCDVSGFLADWHFASGNPRVQAPAGPRGNRVGVVGSARRASDLSTSLPLQVFAAAALLDRTPYFGSDECAHTAW